MIRHFSYVKVLHLRMITFKMAVESKAVGFVSEKYYDEYVDIVPFVQVNSATKALSVLAIHFYDRPSQSFFLTGITGTAGKTTTTVYDSQYL